MSPLLATDQLTVRFGDFVAVRDVCLHVAAGSVHAVIGPNGAGKTSLFNAISGFLHTVRGLRPALRRRHYGQTAERAARRGVARSFQICSIFPNLSVVDNVRMALSNDLPRTRLVRARAVGDASHRQAVDLVAGAGLAEAADRRAADLPYGRRRLLELVTTIALKPRLLLLDEPTSGLAREDIAPVIALIRQATATCGVLLVEHNLDVVQSLPIPSRSWRRRGPVRRQLPGCLARSAGPRSLYRGRGTWLSRRAQFWHAQVWRA